MYLFINYNSLYFKIMGKHKSRSRSRSRDRKKHKHHKKEDNNESKDWRKDKVD